MRIVSLKSSLLIGAISLLSACQTTQTDTSYATTTKQDIKKESTKVEVEPIISTIDVSQHSFKRVENAYITNPKDLDKAVAFAHALRQRQDVNRAHDILKPFIKTKPKSSAFYAETAAILVEKQEYEAAEKMAQKAIKLDPENVDGYYYLAATLEKLEMMEESERSYRKALTFAKEQNDDVNYPEILNALALNLAAQEKFDESSALLLEAKEKEPNNQALERNLRIMTALQQSNGIPVPKPQKKPEIPSTEKSAN